MADGREELNRRENERLAAIEQRHARRGKLRALIAAANATVIHGVGSAKEADDLIGYLKEAEDIARELRVLAYGPFRAVDSDKDSPR